MANDVQVDLAERSYPIRIGRGICPSLGEMAAACLPSKKLLVVSDTHVEPAYGEMCRVSLKKAGYDVRTAVVPAGEPSKSQEQLFALYNECLAHGMDRSSGIVALGGGVVGDLAGYLAASFLRGIAFIQVPTSLLAMVDSSVGGKTGINLPAGKNLVGAFYQPRLVCVDLDTLQTLPQREYLSGLAEVIKYGVIFDETLFEQLAALGPALQQVECSALEEIVARCCAIKAEVVRRDEREGGLRAILNFGHTFGHALENAAGYGSLLHGEAVSIGMVYAAQLSVLYAELSESERDRIRDLLGAVGLPVKPNPFEWSVLERAMHVDKKSVSGVPYFVLADQIGHVTPGWRIDVQDLREVYEWLRKQTQRADTE